MDRDKQSLFAAAFSHKYLQKQKSCMLFQQFDMGNGLQDFLTRLLAPLKSTVPPMVGLRVAKIYFKKSHIKSREAKNHKILLSTLSTIDVAVILSPKAILPTQNL
jgi:hypothetical protein